MIRVALTGHQIERLRGQESKVHKWLIETLLKIKKENAEVELFCGCAPGADELFGNAALYFPRMKLILCLPYKDYRKDELKELKYRAYDIVYMSKDWAPGLNSNRDRYMVNHCDVLLAVWDSIEQGGTWETIQYAKELGKEIIYIDKKIFNI